MKTGILILAAATWVIGQTTTTTGVSDWVGSMANLSATGLLFFLFWWMLTKYMPAERAKDREQRTADRVHNEKVIISVVSTFENGIASMAAELREDRITSTAEMKALATEIGKCKWRNER